jgi:hypothetical protein
MKKNFLLLLVLLVATSTIFAQDPTQFEVSVETEAIPHQKNEQAETQNREPLGAYRIDGKWHVFDYNGDLMFEPINLYQIGGYSEGMILAIRIIDGKKKWTFVNLKGEFVFDFEADGCRVFNEGLAKVYHFIDERQEIPNFGYYNKKGELVIDRKYLDASIFNEGTAWVMNYEERGWIDTTGKFLWQPPGKEFGMPFVEGFAVITDEEGNNGFINRNFEQVVEYKYLEASPFSEGLAMVRDYGRILYIDTTGNIVIPTTRHYARSFKNGYAFTAESDLEGNPQWQVIDKGGIILTTDKYAEVRDFEDGIACVQDVESKKWKFIDPYGRNVLEKEFYYADSMIKGLAWASDDETGTRGYIDMNGEFKVILPPADAYVDFRVNRMLK